MSKARLVITAIEVEGRSPAEVIAAYGVSRSWLYELLARYRAEGDAAFEPRSRRPRTSPRATTPDPRHRPGACPRAARGSRDARRRRVRLQPLERLCRDPGTLDEVEPGAGTLDRRVRWTALSSTSLEVSSRRIVLLVERSVCVVRYEVTALDGPAHVVVRSELVGAEAAPPGVDNDDPRVAPALEHAFEPLAQVGAPRGGALALRTRGSGIGVAAAVGDVIGGGRVSAYVNQHQVVTTVAADLLPGENLTIVKAVGYSWSHDGGADSLRGEAWAAVYSALDLGWDGLLAGQRAALDELRTTATPSFSKRWATPSSSSSPPPPASRVPRSAPRD